MYRYILFIIVTILFFSCNTDEKGGSSKSAFEKKGQVADMIRMPVSAVDPVDTVNVAKFAFEETSFDFGTAREGKFVEHAFKFKNSGTIPLVIQDAKATCGCTVPSWPKEPIPPGGSGEINVKFNTMKKTEHQSKPVTIIANTYPSKTVLKIEGFVIKVY